MLVAGQDAGRAPARTVSLGRLTDKRWPGTVSAASSLLDLAAVGATLDDYYVPVEPHAKTRCIDGRHDPALDESHLGPQVPGGPCWTA